MDYNSILSCLAAFPAPNHSILMLIGYNTNGLAHHDTLSAIDLLAELGYQSVALTIDHHCLPPSALKSDGVRHRAQILQIKERLTQSGLRSVVETGARFLLDPRRKHHPTLLSQTAQDRQQRIDYLKYCIDIAVELESDCVSIWSGVSDDQVALEPGLERLAGSLQTVLQYAEQARMPIGFEPEPGMFIDTMGSFFRMLHWVDHPQLKLTLDLGHLFCLGELPMAPHIQRWADRIINIHIEDMKAGQHLHLMFGEGQMHFPPIIQALKDINYQNGLHVELSRDSHRAPEVARESISFLKSMIQTQS